MRSNRKPDCGHERYSGIISGSSGLGLHMRGRMLGSRHGTTRLVRRVEAQILTENRAPLEPRSIIWGGVGSAVGQAGGPKEG